MSANGKSVGKTWRTFLFPLHPGKSIVLFHSITKDAVLMDKTKRSKQTIRYRGALPSSIFEKTKVASLHFTTTFAF
jgi:hypothetical protein